MSFVNDADFQDDFRKVGKDATADFEIPGAPSDPTDHASSENLNIAAKAADEEDEDEDDDLEDDDELDDEDEDDLDDEDLEDDEDEDEDDVDEDDVDEDEDDEEDLEDDDDELEDDGDAVKARLGDAEARVRAS